jgi:hypothetical protein
VLAVLHAAGIKPEVRQNKHFKVTWHNAAGHKFTLVMPTSTANWESGRNTRAQLRRMLRTMG